MIEKLYVQYGAGNEAIKGWINYDVSPTLRLQKIPLIGKMLRPILNCTFDKEIRYGDITKGLPIKSESIDGIFCSHVLEHLTFEDFHKALSNTYKILKPGGIFRCIVPDFELYINTYVKSVSSNEKDEQCNASIQFLKRTSLGLLKRKRGIIGRLTEMYGSTHRWMWDKYSLSEALSKHGFEKITLFNKGHCCDKMFLMPERDHQFEFGIGLHCIKP